MTELDDVFAFLDASIALDESKIEVTPVSSDPLVKVRMGQLNGQLWLMLSPDQCREFARELEAGAAAADHAAMEGE